MKIIHASIIAFALFLSFTSTVLSQDATIDSLKIELQNHIQQDTIRVNLLNDLANLNYKENTEEALVYLQESKVIAQNLDFKNGNAKRIFIHGQIKALHYNFDEAFKLFNEALKLYETLNNTSYVGKCYNRMGLVLYGEGNKKEAITYYKKALKAFENIGNKKAIPVITNNMGRAYSELGNYDDAIAYYEKTMFAYEELNDEIGVAYSLNNLGIIYFNQGNHPVALNYHEKALKIAKTNNHNWLIAGCLGNIGNIYNFRENYDKAIEHYEGLLKRLENVDKKATAITLNNLGLVYKAKKNYDKAIEVLNKAVKIHKEMNNRFDLVSPLNNIGDVYLERRDYKNAYQYFEQAKTIGIEVENQRALCNSYLGLTKIYINQKNYNKALINAEKSKAISDKLELIDYQRDVNNLLSTIYRNTKNYKQAFESYEQFKTLNDSLFNKKNIEKIAQLEYEYKYKQALDSASIRELQLTKTVQATSQDLEKTKRNYLWSIIGVLIVSMLLGSIIFYQKLKNAKTKTENAIVEQKLLRSQMTPHFIFNSLSVLQGMILNKEEKKSVNYLSKFSKLLRITLENSRDKLVSLSQELTAIQNYLTLQNLENDTYQSTLLVEDTIDVARFEVPPMLIQPFVENAVEHAFTDENVDRKIDIRLTYLDKKLICTIADNGVGYESQNGNKKNHKKSLSTTITSERLKILAKDFKMEGSVTIEDRKKYNAQGTLVTLVIPHKLTIS